MIECYFKRCEYHDKTEDICPRDSCAKSQEQIRLMAFEGIFIEFHENVIQSHNQPITEVGIKINELGMKFKQAENEHDVKTK